MKKIDFVLDKIENFLCTFFACVMAVSILIQVINRNTVRMPVTWCEELARYCMVWLIFVGISAGVKKGSHIGVDALVNLLPDALNRTVRIVVNVAVTVLYGYLTVLAVQITAGIKETGQVSPAMQIPMYLIYAGMIVGLLMSTLRSIQVTAGVISGHEATEDNPMSDF
ncbi:MAG: TRAP transporter small permease [Eubacterium sp.]|nr:TRAP transporter small permease [Eubacterium sp.]MBR0396678.1 TRAP transporter small permease [Eubacterium sp.]